MKKNPHPYVAFERTALWRVLEKSVRALTKNGDITEQTSRDHVIGYLAKTLTDAGFDQVSVLETGTKRIHVVEVREPMSAKVRKQAGIAAAG